MFGDNDSIFWVQFNENDYRSSLDFSKIVRRGIFIDDNFIFIFFQKIRDILVERINNGIHFKDDLIEYTLTNSSSHWNKDSLLQRVPYLTL